MSDVQRGAYWPTREISRNQGSGSLRQTERSTLGTLSTLVLYLIDLLGFDSDPKMIL